MTTTTNPKTANATKAAPSLEGADAPRVLLPEAERVQAVKNLESTYFEYGGNKRVLRAMRRLRLYGNSGASVGKSASSVLVIGPPGSGKSRLLRTAAAMVQPKEVIIGDVTQTIWPVLYVPIDPASTPGALAQKCLRMMNAIGDKKSRESAPELIDRMVSQLIKNQVELAIFDELQHAGHNTDEKSKRVTSNFFKAILNKNACSILMAGTEEAENIFYGNKELVRRSIGEFTLDRFDWNSPAERTQYTVLLAMYAKNIPLKNAAMIAEPKIAYRLSYLSGGLFPLTTDRLVEAVQIALEDGITEMSVELLKEMVDCHRKPKDPDWINPFDVDDAQVSKVKPITNTPDHPVNAYKGDRQSKPSDLLKAA